MTFRKIIVVVAFAMISSIACGEMVAHITGGPVGLLASGTAGKVAGDIISVYTDSDVAANCNFNSQIVVTKTSVLCVYNGKNTAAAS